VGFAARVLIKACRLLLAVTVGVILFIGAVQAGVLRNPLAPKAEGDLSLARSSQSGSRILFVGNSLTYSNGMPLMVRRLAARDVGGPELFAVQYTAPGWSLRRASADEGLLKLLREVHWDDVVLQERSDESAPFFDALSARASHVGAATVIFDLGRGGAGKYREEAQRLGARLAPVWDAWTAARGRRPDLDLYGWDGHHPNRAGSFLIACVFYAVLTGRDPAASSYTAGLDSADARFLQHVARDVVLGA
jgi:hypothetical protein